MKNISFTIPKVVSNCILTGGVFSVLAIVASCILIARNNGGAMTVVGILFCHFFFGGFATFANYLSWGSLLSRAFLRVEINPTGIRNRYCSLRWDEIMMWKLEYLERPSPRTLSYRFYGIVVGVQKTPSDQLSVETYSPKKAIYFPLTETNKRIIEHYYGKEKFEAALNKNNVSTS